MTKRWTAIGATLGAAVGLLGLGYYWLLRRPLARTQGTVRLTGLQDEVEILRDRWGVPHIYARNMQDLMFAQGFVHAQDRLWQMDYQRRVVAGRLAEILGEQAAPVDRWLRILGLRRVVEQEAALLDGDIRADVQAYAAGVSARIAQACTERSERGRLPIEFTLLRYEPEPWTVADALSWAKMMSWGLSINWESELLRAQLIARLGPELAAELEPDYPERTPIIIPPGADYATIGSTALDRAEAARPFIGPAAHEGVGSNNWVLGGSRTASGAPLLANDMHLPMSQPCIWYENHLVAGDLNLTGISLPGIPGVISGHNGHVAWGFTNGFPDVQDLYLERLRRTDDGRVQYEFKGEWLDAQVVREEIRVKGGETVVEEVILTHHGPIINALAPDFAGEQPLALRWTSLEPDNAVRAIFGMNRARTCAEFREALRDWAAPIQNTVYADTEGNIGYSYPGKVPIRAKGSGQVPVPGWTGEYEWTGYIPFEELPHLTNPPQGYVATANNRVVGDDYAHYLGREFAIGDRAQRIIEMIEAREKIDAGYVRQMHFDQVSHSARVIARFLGALRVDRRGIKCPGYGAAPDESGSKAPLMGRSSVARRVHRRAVCAEEEVIFEEEDPKLARVVDLMKGWDGNLAADSAAAAVYEVFVRRMIYVALSDKLGDLTVRYAGKGPTPMLAEGSMFGSRAWVWLQRVLTEPDSHWFDLGNGEKRDDVMRLALRETVEFLETECGPEPSDWAWGKLHTLTYSHVLGRVKPLDKLFNRGPFPLGGDGTTVWATGASRHDLSCNVVIGPPFRFIADLGDLRNSLGLLAPGQSGQPGSKHYDDQVQAWFEGEYHPLLYARQDVEQGAKARLVLLPGANDG